MLAKAVAGEAKVPFFSLAGSDFVEMFVGVGASRVRDLFKEAQKMAPCIIFIDEIDAIGKSRDSRYGGGNDEREQTLNQLLAEMDGFDASKGILILAATNRPEVLDKALLRPGRFDRRIIVDKPDLKGRLETLKVHSKDVHMDETVDLDALALATAGLVGSDLANMINEAAINAVKNGRKFVNQSDLFEAFELVAVGGGGAGFSILSHITASPPCSFSTDWRTTVLYKKAERLFELLKNKDWMPDENACHGLSVETPANSPPKRYIPPYWKPWRRI